MTLIKKLIVKIKTKSKNIFAKLYPPNWSEELFVLKKVKNTGLWTYIISDPKGEEIVGTFYENEFQKANQKQFRTEKIIKSKGDKLYVKWKGHSSSVTVGLIKMSSINEWIFSRTKIFSRSEIWIRFV